MKILGISYCFPRDSRPDLGVFAHELYLEMARQGANVSVIAPYSLIRHIRESIKKEKIHLSISQTKDFIKVIRPNWFNISTRFINNKIISEFNLKTLCRSIKSASREAFKPDWISAYFFQSGIGALYAYDNYPIYVEMGESNIYFYEKFIKVEEIKKLMRKFSGIIAVSKRNYEIIQKRYEIDENLFLLENGVNTSKFKPIDKDYAREKLGFPKNIFIIAFVGAFIERKGPLRVIKALESLKEVKGIFLGRGPQWPSGDKVLFASPVPNDNLPLILSACDAFVLPSIAEGLSLAILEAAACGLPLIISDRDFNRSFLDNQSAIFIDPMSPKDIRDAIMMLKNDKDMTSLLASKSRKIAEAHSIKERVKKLFEFVESGRKKAVRTA